MSEFYFLRAVLALICGGSGGRGLKNIYFFIFLYKNNPKKWVVGDFGRHLGVFGRVPAHKLTLIYRGFKAFGQVGDFFSVSRVEIITGKVLL